MAVFFFYAAKSRIADVAAGTRVVIIERLQHLNSQLKFSEAPSARLQLLEIEVRRDEGTLEQLKTMRR